MRYFIKPRYKSNREDKPYIYGQFSIYQDIEILLKDLRIMMEKGLQSGDAIIIEFANERKGDKNGES